MRPTTTVRDVMHRQFLGVSEADALGDAAELMLAEGADCLVVVRGDRPVGRLSPRDALGALLDGADPESTTVSDVMTPPAPTVDLDASLTDAEERLVTDGSNLLVVVREEEAVGVVTERDVLAATTTHEDVTTTDRSATMTGGSTEGLAGPSADRVDDASEDVTQSICEECGSLAATLSHSNGQLLCSDCQDH